MVQSAGPRYLSHVSSSASAIILHLDESCLGNGREGDNPGGAGGLVEVRKAEGIARRDFAIHSTATTNNRMAIASALTALELLGAGRLDRTILIVSDSQYLIRGMREWVPGWVSRGWTRKGGPIENLELWQALHVAARGRRVRWTWVRGHAKHPKNEYANDLAVGAAASQRSTDGFVASEFAAWLERERTRKRYLDYNPDHAYDVLNRLLRDDRDVPLNLDLVESARAAGA